MYFHKATRGAEKIFSELLVQLVTLVREDHVSATGLPTNHPLVRFANDPEDIEVALMLDDTVVWGALTLMAAASDPIIANFSVRLQDRQLYKCHDIRTRVAEVIDPKSCNSDELIELIDKCCAEIGTKLTDWTADGSNGRHRILIDRQERSPYKSVNESKGPLDRINVRSDGGPPVDLKERSSVVAALKTYKLFRAYADRSDTDAQTVLRQIVEGEIEKCRK